MFLLLIVVVIYGSTVLNVFEIDKLRGDAIASLFYVANWHFIATGQNYFNLFLKPSPLQHLWSLAIEEQFYLAWPLVVVGVLAIWKGSRKAMFVVTIAGIAISTVLMALLYDDANPSRAYYGTEARAHTLLVGCLLALILANGLEVGPRLRRGLAVGRHRRVRLRARRLRDGRARRPRLFYGGDLAFSILVAIVIAAAIQPRGATAQLPRSRDRCATSGGSRTACISGTGRSSSSSPQTRRASRVASSLVLRLSRSRSRSPSPPSTCSSGRCSAAC